MNARVLRVAIAGAGGLALVLSVGVVWAWARGTAAPPPPIAPAVGRSAGQSVDSVRMPNLGAVVAHDPFRARRAPSAVVYDPVALAAGPPPLAPPKPTLVLSGIVWGSAPQAVIEGLPGIDGPRVMRVGDMVAGLTVRRIDASRVVIAGLDTTWTLTVREPWK